MNSITTAARVFKRIASHESGQGKPWVPIMRFLGWQLRKRSYPKPVIITAFNGAKLKCYPDRVTSSGVIYFGWPDWHEMHWLNRVLRPGDGFLDVGANVGIYSVLAASKVMPGGRVMAFEPEPGIVAILKENFELNGLDSAQIINAAVGSEDGECFFQTGQDATGKMASAGESGVATPMVALDTIVTQAQQYMVGKIDVEGFEVSAFQGAKKLLSEHRPYCWLIETNDCDDRSTLHQLLKDAGYEFYEIKDKGYTLQYVPIGGPYPDNSVAICNLDWVRERVPNILIYGPAA
jgi:FkbM family methyltransferase